MWDNFMERLMDIPIIICTILSFVIPFSIYKVNQKFHKDTDPPWRKKE